MNSTFREPENAVQKIRSIVVDDSDIPPTRCSSGFQTPLRANELALRGESHDDGDRMREIKASDEQQMYREAGRTSRELGSPIRRGSRSHDQKIVPTVNDTKLRVSKSADTRSLTSVDSHLTPQAWQQHSAIRSTYLFDIPDAPKAPVPVVPSCKGALVSPSTLSRHRKEFESTGRSPRNQTFSALADGGGTLRLDADARGYHDLARRQAEVRGHFHEHHVMDTNLCCGIHISL
ncbi:hypothetical protein IMY05_C4598000100 [Salix suchowensis]|nr:hypothetical protein IMY05_C4598000100 [Salix suchowensis]